MLGLGPDLLMALVDTAIDGMIVIDQRGLVQLYNPACVRLFGYEPGEVLGRNVKMLMPEPYQSQHDDYLERYLRTHEPRVIGSGREVMGRRSDGSTFPMHLSVGETTVNGNSLFVGIIHDMTERTERERLLAQKRARLRAVVDTAMDGVMLCDIDGRIVDTNPAFRELFGYPKGQLLGTPAHQLMPDMSAPAPVARQELRGHRRDGSTFPLELSIGDASQSGEQIFVGIVRDITERTRIEERIRERNEALARSNMELERFASVASHDLNEPLRKIVSFSELLKRDYGQVLDEQGRMYLEFATDAARRMRTLIQDLLTYARLPHRPPPDVPVDLNGILDTVLSDLSLQITECGAQVAYDPLPQVRGDEGQMRQLLQNLLSNALKYHAVDRTPEVHIRGRVVGTDSLGGGSAAPVVEIEVADNGIGFDSTKAQEILRPFRRLHGIHEYEGTGIGLAICHKIIRRHGGELLADGKEGMGATFTVRLPGCANGHDALPNR